MTKIEVANVGPIVEIAVEIPDDQPGGVIVFRGENGTGKSTAIEACNALITKTGRLVPRDGAKKGQVVGLDRKINVGASTTRSGDGEVASLAGRFDFADLIDPGLEKPEARAAKRIQSLIGLTGVAADASLFYDMVGGKDALERMLDPKALADKDPVSLAGKIKRAIEDEAKLIEGQASQAAKNATVAREAFAGVDTSKPHDSSVLQSELMEATKAEATIRTQRQAYVDSEMEAAKARLKLAEHEKSSAVTVDAAQRAYDVAMSIFRDAAQKRLELTKLLEESQTAENNAERDALAAQRNLATAQQAEGAIEALKEVIAMPDALPCPSESDLQAAMVRVAKAQEAFDLGASIRAAISKQSEADKFSEQAADLAKQAGKKRDTAKAVYEVLSKQIPEGPLYVVAGELVIDTDDAEAEPFDRLSEGERWKIALHYGVDALRDGGFVCVPQHAWEALDPSNRAWVAEYCREHGVWTITAEAAAGELRAEVFHPAESQSA